jgi:hypothetical protein
MIRVDPLPLLVLPLPFPTLTYVCTIVDVRQFVEGCWQFYRRREEPFPGLVVGTALGGKVIIVHP